MLRLWWKVLDTFVIVWIVTVVVQSPGYRLWSGGLVCVLAWGFVSGCIESAFPRLRG